LFQWLTFDDVFRVSLNQSVITRWHENAPENSELPRQLACIAQQP